MEAPIFWGSVLSIPGRLEALLRHGYVLPKGAEDEIPLIMRDLEDVIGILHGQRNKKPEEHAMFVWTKEVRELSYDMEDFIDQYEHAAAGQSWSIRRSPRHKIIHRRMGKTTSRLPSNLRQRLWMANKIREFSKRVQEALQRYSVYNLGGAVGTSSARYGYFGHWHPGPSGNNAHPLVGIGAATDKLEEWLLGIHDAEQQKLRVVSIVGFGGIGKTALANELYRKVGQQFECRAFIRVSRKPDMRRIFISMLSQVRPHLPPDNWKVHSLISSIRTHLQDKRYLIILDDLWAMTTWDIIKYALPEDNSGSRIIITTELEELAQQCCGYDSKFVFKMKPLGEDDSGELFFRTVFGTRDCPQELKEVSCDIIRKCGGYPLAIVIVASMLRSQLNIKEQWDYLNNSLGHILMINPAWEGMKQVLSLSYDNLSKNLKACMLYMSMYPEGSIIFKDDLVNQWIAEGFIGATEGEVRREILRACFDELVGQNLIQPVHIDDNGDVLSCIVHPLVLNYIITYKSIEENFVTAIQHSETSITLADKVRRLSLHYGNADDAVAPTNMRLSQVRTLAFFGVSKCMPSIVQFRHIQVLILHLWGDEGVISLDLTRISELFRLRYFMVASNVTLELGTHMSGIQHLETLKIDARVSAVPSDIVHLPGLLHLSLPAETNLPNGINHMTSLCTLGYFDLSSNSTENVESLSSLTNLQDLQLTCSTTQEREHSNLEKKMQFLLRSILGKLSNLKSLTLTSESYRNAKSPDDTDPTSMIILSDDFTSTFSPPELIRRLELSPRICIFSYFPKCIIQLDNLCILKIGVGKIGSNGLEVVRGLPNLNVLSLYIHTKPAERIVIGKTGFSVLKSFKFKCCQPLLEFEPDALPSLRKLKLCFNASRTNELSIPVGIKHLSGVEEVCAKIGRAGSDETYRTAAEAALKEAMKPGGHAICARVRVKCVSQMCFMEDRISSTTGYKESESQKQHETLEEGSVKNEEIMEDIVEHDVRFHSSRCIPALELSGGITLSVASKKAIDMEQQQHQKQKLVESRSQEDNPGIGRVPIPESAGRLSAGESGSVTSSSVGVGAALSQINEAFRLAAELMNELPETQNDPAYLAGHCHGIVRAYVAAIRMLPSHGGDVAGLLPPFSGDLLRLFSPPPDQKAGPGGAANPFLGSPSTQLGRLMDTFGPRASDMVRAGVDVAGTSSGGPVRRVVSSSRGSSPVQPRQGTRRRESGERTTVMVPVQRAGNTDQPPDDGYTWRKYGQKGILGSRFPRCYYRCTHKNYYGCEAKKKVQRLDDDPYMYEVTYCGNHTCLTSTTPLLTLPAPGTTAAATMTTNSPTRSAAIRAQDLAMVAGEHHAPALSTAIQLGISWMPSSLVGAGSSSGAGEGSSSQVNVNTSATAGRDTDYPVMDLADAMFNSSSSGGSSMDALFSSHDPRDR